MTGPTCDICGYVDESAAAMVVHECNDGLNRCKICRLKAVYGRVLSSDEEDVAYARGEGDRRRDMKR